MNNILVVAPHPDDETLGCGGVLLRHAYEGDAVHWLIMSTIDNTENTKNKFNERKDEIKQVSELYSFTSVQQADFITTRLDTYPKFKLIEVVSKTINRVKPNIVYIPYRNDVHSDHTEVFDAVASCMKSFRYPSIKCVRAYETISETEFSINPSDTGFKPNLWIDISNFLEDKINIMKIYKDEMADHPFPRSEENIRALASLRGSSSGFKSAESFITLKEII